jgi:hypothetical protein
MAQFRCDENCLQTFGCSEICGVPFSAPRKYWQRGANEVVRGSNGLMVKSG